MYPIVTERSLRSGEGCVNATVEPALDRDNLAVGGFAGTFVLGELFELERVALTVGISNLRVGAT